MPLRPPFLHCCLAFTPSPGGPENSFAYAYCHGFLSGPASVKGQALRKTLRETGVELNLLDLNAVKDDPGSITCSGAVEAVRAFHLKQKSASGNPGLKLRLVGSSLGGFISARSDSTSLAEVCRTTYCAQIVREGSKEVPRTTYVLAFEILLGTKQALILSSPAFFIPYVCAWP